MSLSRVRVCGLFARVGTLVRAVNVGPYLISVKFVPQSTVHDTRCGGCVSAYSSPLSFSLSRLSLARLCGRLSCWFRRSYTPSARIPSVITPVMSFPPSKPWSTCWIQRDAAQATQTPQLKSSVCKWSFLSVTEYPGKAPRMFWVSSSVKQLSSGSSSSICFIAWLTIISLQCPGMCIG